MRIALIGSRGVPARYSGFETCVEQVGLRLVNAGHDVTVYCRRAQGEPQPEPETYEGMRLVYLPALRRKTLETLSHTLLSVLHLMRKPVDVVVVFNGANAIFLPLLRLRGMPTATHVDGLEWRRSKWQGLGQTYYRLAESLSVRWSDMLIADAQGIADYYTDEFSAPTRLLSYGAPIIEARRPELLEPLELTPHSYHLVVARFEPENHVDVIVEGYRSSDAKLPLIVVGSAPYSDDYTAKVKSLADDRVRFLGGVWDQDLLDQLYANALTYLHGHSVGGTNPSLLRALGAGAAPTAFDVDFNREVIGAPGRYFSDAADVAREIESAEADPAAAIARGQESQRLVTRYDWDDVAAGYERMCLDLTRVKPRRRRANKLSGRRNTPGASIGERAAQRSSAQ